MVIAIENNKRRLKFNNQEVEKQTIKIPVKRRNILVTVFRKTLTNS